MAFADHYKALGLPSGEEGVRLSDKQINRAFKLKALELHPDKRSDVDPATVNADFQTLGQSYQILRDAASRRQSDAELLHRLRQPQNPPRSLADCMRMFEEKAARVREARRSRPGRCREREEEEEARVRKFMAELHEHARMQEQSVNKIGISAFAFATTVFIVPFLMMVTVILALFGAWRLVQRSISKL